MTDLFRGYDLTTVADYAARKAYERDRGSDWRSWEELDGFSKQQIKSSLLPIITDVLEALESEQVKPTEAKAMRVYEWSSFQQRETGVPGYEDDPNQCDLTTCTTWVLHMNVPPAAKDAVLERMAILPETTGEYTYGDSWEEWGEEAKNRYDQHMAIYFDATPRRVVGIGFHLANHATFAAMRATAGDGSSYEVPPYAISTSGDYAEQIKDLL